MMMRGLKYSCYVFCGLKSYIRFYSKLTFIEPALFKIVVLPNNAGNRQQPPQKKIQLAEVEREAPSRTTPVSNERLFPVLLQIELQFTFRSSQ